MAELLLLRHSVTRGNLEGRYIGSRTDEPLCGEGIRLLVHKSYPAVNWIYVSPMKRCVETAQLLWGEKGQENIQEGNFSGMGAGHNDLNRKIPMTLVPEFRECDFGEFENHNYQELNGNPSYQAWIDSGGTLPFPGGESAEQFKRRCREGFQRVVSEILRQEEQVFRNEENVSGTEPGKTEDLKYGRRKRATFRVALVVHGGTIMAILEYFGFPKREYFDYQVKNGCGYVLTPVEGTDLWNYQCLS